MVYEILTPEELAERRALKGKGRRERAVKKVLAQLAKKYVPGRGLSTSTFGLSAEDFQFVKHEFEQKGWKVSYNMDQKDGGGNYILFGKKE